MSRDLPRLITADAAKDEDIYHQTTDSVQCSLVDSADPKEGSIFKKKSYLLWYSPGVIASTSRTPTTTGVFLRS